MDDFVIVQQELDDELTHEYLVGPEKERAKGPPGRKPPQRKSMMPSDDVRISGIRPLSESSLIVEEDEVEVDNNNAEEALEEALERKPVARKPVGAIHAAFAKELETKLQKKRPPSQSSLCSEDEGSISTSTEDRLSQLDSRIKRQEGQLQNITSKLEDLDQLKLEYTKYLSELKSECTKVLTEAREARDLYQALTQKLLDLNPELDKNSGSHTVQDIENA